ncbi:MAG: hypothetical protein ACT4QD_16030 [Acidobacteriota bacterium]
MAGALTPKKPAWMRATVGAGAVTLALYVALAWWQPWQPGRLGGLIFGSLAAALFVNAGLYPFRRRWQARPLGTVQRWLQLHVYGSVLAMLFVLIHMGFRWPAGTFGWWLFGLTVWTTATGMVGVLLQKALPIAMARHLRVEAIYERIPDLIQRLLAEADKLVTGAGETLSSLHAERVRPMLAAPAPRWSYVLDSRAARARQLEPLSRMEAFVDEGDRDRLRDLTAVVNDKLDLDVHSSLQRALRWWLYTHVPAAIVLLGLLVVHVFAVVYF